MAGFCTALSPCDLPTPRGPLAKRPPQETHFQQLATVQNSPPRTPFRSGACRSPRGGGGWGFRLPATGYGL